MNKTELTKAISEKSGFTIKDAHAFLDAFIEVTTEALKRGDDVQLVGFGYILRDETLCTYGYQFSNKEASRDTCIQWRKVQTWEGS